MPIQNVKNLNLSDEVINSVKEGKFHIYAISSIDEGIEILTGVPAGKKNKEGKFPAGTIKYLAYEKLKRYAENAKENIILGQDVEAGEKLNKGDTITLTIPNIYHTYPDFASEGYTVIDVRSFCEDNGLALEIKYQASDTEKEGTIIYQNMSPGTMVKQGATVRITVVKNDVASDTGLAE